jgi:hypothetical protein
MLGRMLREWPPQEHVRFLARLLDWGWHAPLLEAARPVHELRVTGHVA